MCLLCFSCLLELWSNWTLSVGSRDYLAPGCCTALEIWVTTPFPLAGWKPAEVSSTLSFVLGTVYKSPPLEAEGSRQLGWHLLPPHTFLKKHLGAWMPIHGTDSCSWGLRVMAMQVGKDDLWVFSRQTICSETWQSLGLFQIFSFKLLHSSDELASASRLCLQPRYSAQTLSPV